MPKFQKASPWIQELFASLVADLSCEQRKMFGYPCAFVGGQMFAGVFGDTLIVRLAPTDREALLRLAGAGPFDPMGGRPMKEYVQLSDAMLEDEEALGHWARKGFAFASALPPKAPKSQAPRPAKGPTTGKKGAKPSPAAPRPRGRR